MEELDEEEEEGTGGPGCRSKCGANENYDEEQEGTGRQECGSSTGS